MQDLILYYSLLHFNINKRDDKTIDSIIPTTQPKEKEMPRILQQSTLQY